jgi:hypothetical protein
MNFRPASATASAPSMAQVHQHSAACSTLKELVQNEGKTQHYLYIHRCTTNPKTEVCLNNSGANIPRHLALEGLDLSSIYAALRLPIQTCVHDLRLIDQDQAQAERDDAEPGHDQGQEVETDGALALQRRSRFSDYAHHSPTRRQQR